MRELTPHGVNHDLKSVSYIDDRSDGSPPLFCELPGYTVGASCTATTGISDTPASSLAPAASLVPKRRW